jgi:quercetin dioxygenase-like cupin family protein
VHVAPDDLRGVRHDGLVIRFATLGDMAYALAEVPKSGSRGTTLEQRCELPHWGVVIEGELTFVSADERQAIPAGHAFHVRAGRPEHHFETEGPAVVAGFQPVNPDIDLSDERLRAQGFEPAPSGRGATVVPATPAHPVKPGEVRVESWRMSDYVMSRVRMGERSGYTAGWCDAPHWGMVTSGRLAIEWENDVEILSKGDIFHCGLGPPGHRVEAADPVTFVDLTPVAVLESGVRLVDWRRSTLRAARSKSRGIAVAALG